MLLTLGVTAATAFVSGGWAQAAPNEPALGEATDAPAAPTAVPQAIVAAGPGGPRPGAKLALPGPEDDRIDDLSPSRARPLLMADRFHDPPSAEPVADAALAPEIATDSTAAAVAVPQLSIPGMGIDRPIEEYPCNRSAPPDDHVYRWGCAGANNLYLMGHARSVFKPLHDAYIGGRLKVGMEVSLVDASGQVLTYHVTTWRLVRPDDSTWAIAAQPVPSMTLQTCVGADSEYRLLIRLVA